MDHEAEVIKQQMRATRAGLTEKLETLEEQVASKVRHTTEAVSQTVDTVKGAVEQTVSTVSGTVQETVETVKETFDIPHQVEKHPWPMMAGAAALGFLAGRLIEDATERSPRSSLRSHSTRSNGKASRRQGTREDGRQQPAQADSRPAEPSTWDRLTERLEPALDKLRGLAVGVATGVVGKMILNAVPDNLRKEVESVVHEVTTALGGKPLPGFLAEDTSEGRQPEPAQARW
jgi:ElaB/YqjD/DUF883 family membrane-anchored ribosome-binding protein